MAGNKPKWTARVRQHPDSEYWQTIGAAWPTKDGGISVKLHSIPTQWNGDVLLIEPKDNGEAS
jgi:hypothetical protein